MSLLRVCAAFPEVHANMVAYGVLGCAALGLRTSSDFVIDQSACVLSALAAYMPYVSLARSLGVQEQMVAIIKRVLVKRNSVGNIALLTCCLTLRLYCFADEEICQTLRGDEEFMTALQRLAHSSYPIQRTSEAARGLLTKLAVPSHESIRSACEDLLSMLPPSCTTTQSCPVCMTSTEDDLALLPCTHVAHRQCLQQWLVTSSRDACPMCKTCILSTIQQYLRNAT